MDIQSLAEKFKRRPTDVIGIDISRSEVRAARIRKNGDSFTLVAVNVLGSIVSPGGSLDQPETLVPLILPSKLKAKYASIALSGKNAVVKILSIPGAFDDSAIAKVVDNLNLDNPDEYRISYKLVVEGHGRSESRAMGVALPATQVSGVVSLFHTGVPAPFSVEISGLATMSAFLHGPAAAHENDAVGVMDFGEESSTFALFNKNVLALVRRFDVGTSDVLRKVQESLGVDMETAQGIISDGSFDISQSVGEVMDPLVKQLIVSRDFVERRENCHVSKLYVAGGLVVSKDSLDEIRSSMELEVATWNPFDGMNMATDAIPRELVGQEWRFTAAVGACLATFEETA
ncbi:MAG: pilus assembly protein PilM [Lentisphaerae bacterium]|nr:pilus assembly protein PilM [Lentisphaerota bacterium]